MKRVAFVFPGQGSQEVGMGKKLYDNYDEIKKMFMRADQILETSLSQLMFEGPAEELTKTENAQPALLLNSVAVDKILTQNGIDPIMTAGHSLGEYSALVVSGSLPLSDALPLVRKRGKLMENAYPEGKGAMAAVLGLNADVIQEIVEKANSGSEETVDLANLNCPGQIVISGTKVGIDRVIDKLKEYGAKRVLPLNVSGPFHSRLMKPAGEGLERELERVEMKDARIPVYANVTADPVTDKKEINELLIKQLYSPVRFEESISNMLREELDAIVEVGNGKVLSGLVKKINRRTKTFAVQDPDSISAFIEWYKEES